MWPRNRDKERKYSSCHVETQSYKEGEKKTTNVYLISTILNTTKRSKGKWCSHTRSFRYKWCWKGKIILDIPSKVSGRHESEGNPIGSWEHGLRIYNNAIGEVIIWYSLSQKDLMHIQGRGKRTDVVTTNRVDNEQRTYT